MLMASSGLGIARGFMFGLHLLLQQNQPWRSRKAQHRRTVSTHIVLIPRLLTPTWQKHLNKVSDIVLSLPVGHPAWPSNMHEPLTVGLVFPFIRYRLWRLHISPLILDLEKHLRSVWKANPSAKGFFCADFGASRGSWQVCRRSWCGRCYTAPVELKFQIAQPENDKGSKWKKRKDESRFLTACDSDMLCCPFQCDLCWFINLCKTEPNLLSHTDKRLVGYIRRVNLDLMWSRECGTVATTLAAVTKGQTMSIKLGLVP